MSENFEENFMEDEGDLLEVIQDQQEEPEDQNGTENQGNDSQNEEENRRVVKPKKRVTRPLLKLDATRLVGPRGISVLESTFKDIKFKGKGHELEDLNKVLRTLEHWALRLFPKMSFDDCINKIEDLGLKKNVMVHVTKIRLGMEEPDIPNEPDIVENEVVDPFDELISNQPKPPQPPSLTEEQRARMLRNRLIAEEIRMKKLEARQKQMTEQANITELIKSNECNNQDSTPIAEDAKISDESTLQDSEGTRLNKAVFDTQVTEEMVEEGSSTKIEVAMDIDFSTAMGDISSSDAGTSKDASETGARNKEASTIKVLETLNYAPTNEVVASQELFDPDISAAMAEEAFGAEITNISTSALVEGGTNNIEKSTVDVHGSAALKEGYQVPAIGHTDVFDSAADTIPEKQ